MSSDTFSSLVAELAETWHITDDDVAAKAMDAIAAKPVYAGLTPEQLGNAFDMSLQAAMGATGVAVDAASEAQP